MNKQRAAFLSIVSNFILVLLKIGAGIAMGSLSVISEAAHSGIDLIASMVALLSIQKAVQPADKQHPFGHGKFENVSGFFEAILIFVAAGIIIIEAIKKLLHPGKVEELTWGIAIMALSVIMNIGISQLLFKVSKKTGSIALEADAMHLQVDVFTSLSVMVGLVLIKITHWVILDPVIAIIVAGLICRASFNLTKKSLKDLVDEQLPEHEIAKIKEIFDGDPSVIEYHKLRTRKCGQQREIDIHVVMAKSLELEQAHAMCDTIEHRIQLEFPETTITIHVEPSSID